MIRVLVFLRFIVVFLISFSSTSSLLSQTSIDKLSEMFEANKVSVLLVYAARDTSVSQGSAFLIAPDGLAISNYHVFKDKDNAMAIDYEGNKYDDITIIYSNPDMDFIIFRINGVKLPHLKMAANQASIGEPCFAIGNPMGLDQTLSTGIVSGYRDNDNYIQTSAEITFGSSGGPLFNSIGEVIGITTAGYGQANLNFAINIQKIDIENTKNRLSDSPDQIVRKYLTYLGNREFANAYSLSDNPLWIKNGGLKWFVSTDAYGAINSVNIKEIQVESISNTQAIVYTHYFAEDSLHTSRHWKQNYYLEKKANGWVIVKAKLK